MNVQEEYRETTFSTQSQGQLVVMLYDGAIRFLKIAQEKMEENDHAGKGIYIGKAQDIISELNNSLDMDSGGELSKNLRALYNFLYRHLNQANMERDPRKLQDCIGILQELHEAWEQVADEQTTSEAG